MLGFRYKKKNVLMYKMSGKNTAYAIEKNGMEVCVHRLMCCVYETVLAGCVAEVQQVMEVCSSKVLCFYYG